MTWADVRIPTLDLAMQATELIAPVMKWGKIARSAPMPGTYYLYTDDYKISGLIKRPGRLPASGCRVAVEANFSTLPETPREEFRKGLFHKRNLSRYWQSRGVRIIADLNVDPVFRAENFIGIPFGWRVYAVRHQSGIDLAEIEADHAAAAEHAGTRDILFCVFGGWRKVRDFCAARGWPWVAEDIHMSRGSTDGTRRWR